MPVSIETIVVVSGGLAMLAGIAAGLLVAAKHWLARDPAPCSDVFTR